MTANDVREALQQVKEIRRNVLEKRQFRGFSGPAKALSGAMALGCAALLAHPAFPQTPEAHLTAWLGLAAVAFMIQIAALFRWFWTYPPVGRDRRVLRPLVDALAPFGVGVMLTVALVVRGEYNLLFGVWMCAYGLTYLATRRILVKSVVPLGLLFIAGGAVSLLHPRADFLNPWPMGLMFGAGEIIGGYIFWRNRSETPERILR